ncbi:MULTISPECIES: WXG100 family type VII secretion target [Virgibacillus]|jgi:WXG100 family type VII secretion target|uniref:ESAT-6-like protein n=1 Tax=Virgibacillus halodenitrificans TaxID=1482 RepID=A0AAC9IX76_VIRHA|nr:MULTISPECIES: WXG100 family type VII secretion target [Virgibacillus]AIF42589.1 hypothetical protein X953_04405 [Virgibacillus sp. SK37]APC47308.1 hypothetical protein BME96_03605 [Virgibacillus halodenitrificans]MBD1221587.1 WXG100 family type VII secretion target [Virgibacillus halodenitrificans]MCG1029662.1 WXG100 family type VII secretion target [Virgibacillus halodenitrificans]MCJ0932409.1 WXG100 family type VII secretion target [Virgibacillus halodenitrificans]
MSGMIRLNPEELEDFARRYGIESGNVNAILKTLDDLIAQLGDAWEGGASQAFQDQYVELRPSFVNMVTLLEDIQRQLASSADTLRQTDANIAGQIRG